MIKKNTSRTTGKVTEKNKPSSNINEDLESKITTIINQTRKKKRIPYCETVDENNTDIIELNVINPEIIQMIFFFNWHSVDWLQFISCPNLKTFYTW